MLVSFAFENWACFGGRAEFSMIATKSRVRRETLARWGRGSILPVAAVYGENASGKTSFVKALDFVRDFVLRDVGPSGSIPVRPCLTAGASCKALSEFSLMFLAEERLYRFTFAVTKQAVVREKLERLTTRGVVATDGLVYERADDKVHIGLRRPSEQLTLATHAIVPHRLFLSIASQLNAGETLPAFRWFANTLLIVTPNTHWTRLDTLCGGRFEDKVNDCLSRFAAGTRRLDLRPAALEDLRLGDAGERLAQTVKQGETLIAQSGREFCVFRRNADGSLDSQRLVFVHSTEDGAAVDLPIGWESDGTLRMVNLAPALQMIEAGSRVLVVDELERSLHPHVCRGMVEDFLRTRDAKRRSQLIFTTHNTQLIADKTLRTDEYWIVDKESAYGSPIYSFSDFVEARAESDLAKAYNIGRMGGIPHAL